MSTPVEPALRDIATLTRVAENVFRKLIRMLVGKMSLKKLHEMTQIIFVEEAEATLKRESPGKGVSLADIGLLTGVDTRVVKKIRAQIELSDPIHEDQAFLDGFMPLFKVFDLWVNDERFSDPATGKPRALPMEGEGATFPALVKASIQARGLTPQAVLKRLKETGVVEVDAASGRVVLRQEDNIFISRDDLDLLDVGFTAIGHLAGTIAHNIRHCDDAGARYFQRGSWNYQFAPETMGEVRSTIHRYLREADARSRELITSLADDQPRPGQYTAGISMFYFEDAPHG